MSLSKEKRKEYDRKRRATNPEEHRAKQKRYRQNNPDLWMKYNYDITQEQYDKMLADQGGVCAICKKTNRKNKRLCIDHCHKTDKVRGLLCDDCNLMLGHSKDNEDVLREAISYLERNTGLKGFDGDK